MALPWEEVVVEWWLVRSGREAVLPGLGTVVAVVGKSSGGTGGTGADVDRGAVVFYPVIYGI